MARFGDALVEVLQRMQQPGTTMTPGDFETVRLEANKVAAAAAAAEKVIDPATGTLRNALSWVKLFDQILVADGTFTFSGIYGGYRHLRIVGSLRSDDAIPAIDAAWMTFNGDSGNNYFSYKKSFSFNDASSDAEVAAGAYMLLATVPAGGAPANYFGIVDFSVLDYSRSSVYKSTFYLNEYVGTAASTGIGVELGGGTWASTAPIASIEIVPGTGTNWVAGSRLTVYGMAG